MNNNLQNEDQEIIKSCQGRIQTQLIDPQQQKNSNILAPKSLRDQQEKTHQWVKNKQIERQEFKKIKKRQLSSSIKQQQLGSGNSSLFGIQILKSEEVSVDGSFNSRSYRLQKPPGSVILKQQSKIEQLKQKDNDSLKTKIIGATLILGVIVSVVLYCKGKLKPNS